MHTPGPWKVKVDQYNAHAIKGPDGKSVASVIQRRPEVSDNARLIAAAPDMLELLKGFVAIEEDYRDKLSVDGLRVLNGAIAVISRAEGRS